jgi:hypothetical protein
VGQDLFKLPAQQVRQDISNVRCTHHTCQCMLQHLGPAHLARRLNRLHAATC